MILRLPDDADVNYITLTTTLPIKSGKHFCYKSESADTYCLVVRKAQIYLLPLLSRCSFFWNSENPESEQERTFNKAIARARKSTYRGTKEQCDDKYAVEEEKSWAILQRQSRLQKSQIPSQNKNKEQSIEPPGDEEHSMVEKELKQLRIDYKKSLIQLDLLRRNMIYGAISEQFMVLLVAVEYTLLR
ncbi:hypothetical protein PHISCL_02311 [Aspergillus sclerotialis]|uniref:Uncharacterized protein n=1 Tax=Aspergillus sclerotialis TaxID=2070753 RepID=A0A3A2ZQC1_9EURO|nr:hypothetical protein PHISCL_02311 [Aspergillus sclerotialis]